MADWQVSRTCPIYINLLSMADNHRIIKHWISSPFTVSEHYDINDDIIILGEQIIYHWVQKKTFYSLLTNTSSKKNVYLAEASAKKLKFFLLNMKKMLRMVRNERKGKSILVNYCNLMEN